MNISSYSQYQLSIIINSALIFKGDYTYERVFKDGIWCIYVCDGDLLIEFYPE
ncbi:MAG: hypothetical protein IPL53_08315 [Ignavibacteria bacterium]|nr:hypothetical protein [Ignavibacteria bacterium]